MRDFPRAFLPLRANGCERGPNGRGPGASGVRMIAGVRRLSGVNVPAAPASSIVRSTLLALTLPRRLVPILLVCVPLVLLQWRTSGREPFAAPLAVAMCVSFVLAAPVSWRVLFPEGIALRNGALRLLLYVTIGAGIILFLGDTVPRVLDMKRTLLTMRSSLLVCLTLFLVGGWGLGRDIALEARVAQLAREAEHAQLLALRSHLDPHFLFNTLNAIAEWCREDGEIAERAVLELAGVMRAVLAGVKAPTWSFAEEMKLVRAVYGLHLLRDPNLFELEWDVPDDLPPLRVPTMIVLPLAENSVKHGPGAGHRGKLRVEARLAGRDKERLVVRIENAGPYTGPRDGSDGVPTVERRLRLAYDRGASLSVRAAGANRTLAVLDMPAEMPS